MSTCSTGAELEQARVAYGRAFNRFALGLRSETADVLADAQAALGHLGTGCGAAVRPGAAFIAGRIADTGALIAALRVSRDAARGDVATSLLAVDFLLRAVEAQQGAAAAPEFCVNCHSTHLVASEGGTPDAPLYQCVDCGLIAAYPTA